REPRGPVLSHGPTRLAPDQCSCCVPAPSRFLANRRIPPSSLRRSDTSNSTHHVCTGPPRAVSPLPPYCRAPLPWIHRGRENSRADTSLRTSPSTADRLRGVGDPATASPSRRRQRPVGRGHR